MHYWIRDFKNNRTGQRFRVYSEAQYIPALREQVAEQTKDAEWIDDMVYQHDPSLDMKRDGQHSLVVEALG